MTWGWRWVFFSFAIPGLVIAVVWYLLVRTKPGESAFVSRAELETITQGQETATSRREKYCHRTAL
ncbi:D-galactonate transporter [Leclercia adecarboxylata]|uniref:D-galactonate transporter n=1 Tax=Leclercia adecarboxylata TaxID=83655 RepID=A0A4U9IE06_9ENTR|nr:D-galactonate transporter [Leclercia adecarboxylata]